MFVLRFPEMSEIHLSGIFSGLIKQSPLFNSEEKATANLKAIGALQ